MAAGGCRATTGSHVEKYLDSSGGVVDTGIRQEWRGRGRAEGVGLRWLWVREKRETGFWYYGTETGDTRVGG